MNLALLLLLLIIPNPVGFHVRLMHACEKAPLQQRPLEFMGNSIALEIKSSGKLLLNESDFRGRPLEETLKLVYSTRAHRTLLMQPTLICRMAVSLKLLIVWHGRGLSARSS